MMTLLQFEQLTPVSFSTDHENFVKLHEHFLGNIAHKKTRKQTDKQKDRQTNTGKT